MMRLDTIDARPLTIPFKQAFRHASAERSAMQSLWVDVRTAGGATGIGEGCPRHYVTGETIASALAFCDRHRSRWLSDIVDVDSLRAWTAEHSAEVDADPAAWTAVELALLDALGQEAGVSIEALLGAAALSGPYRYTAVLGDATHDVYTAQLQRYVAMQFRDFKIKLSADAGRDAAKVAALAAVGLTRSSLRADANNLFDDADAATAHLAALGDAFFAVEEPLRPCDYTGMRTLGRARQITVILDESAQRIEQLDALSADPAQWIVNLRISKMGGLLRSIDFASRAEQRGIRLIVGAHVGESSVLTRAALAVAEFARANLVAQEGAFGTHLLQHDPATPTLMFGHGGLLDIGRADLRQAGLGLTAGNG